MRLHTTARSPGELSLRLVFAETDDALTTINERLSINDPASLVEDRSPVHQTLWNLVIAVGTQLGRVDRFACSRLLEHRVLRDVLHRLEKATGAILAAACTFTGKPGAQGGRMDHVGWRECQRDLLWKHGTGRQFQCRCSGARKVETMTGSILRTAGSE